MSVNSIKKNGHLDFATVMVNKTCAGGRPAKSSSYPIAGVVNHERTIHRQPLTRLFPVGFKLSLYLETNPFQIEFSTWHYIEGVLWASLVEIIFQNQETQTLQRWLPAVTRFSYEMA